jgi:hypothetical protein
LRKTENSNAKNGLFQEDGKALLFEINGGHGYVYPLPEYQGDNAAAFGSL